MKSVIILVILGVNLLTVCHGQAVAINTESTTVDKEGTIVTTDKSTDVSGTTGGTSSSSPGESTTSATATASEPGPETTPAPIVPTTTQGPSSSTTPKPMQWEWHVNDSESVCIIAKFKADIYINYIKTDNSTATGKINLPEDAQLNQTVSHCGNQTQVLQIQFVKGTSAKGGEPQPNTLKFTFSQKDGKVIVSDFELHVYNLISIFENATVDEHHGGLSNTSLFATSSGHSYICNSGSDVKLGALGHVSFSDLQIEAFRTTSDSTFSLAEDCNADINNIVPIAVGCSLAALVVVVLVAYLIGRRQKRQRGYESQGL